MSYQNQESIEHNRLMNALDETGEDAPCSNYPDAFFAGHLEPGGSYTRSIAISLCQGCPVKNLCADYGIRWQPEFGIYGGLLPYERRKLRRARMASGEVMPNLEEAREQYLPTIAADLEEELAG